MVYVLAIYTPKLMEYNEISRNESLVNTLHSLEDQLSDYQITYGGTGDIKKFTDYPDKYKFKEGLFIIQTCINKLLLCNRKRAIGYFINDYKDTFIAEFVIIKLKDKLPLIVQGISLNNHCLLDNWEGYGEHKNTMNDTILEIKEGSFTLRRKEDIKIEESIIL